MKQLALLWLIAVVLVGCGKKAGPADWDRRYQGTEAPPGSDLLGLDYKEVRKEFSTNAGDAIRFVKLRGLHSSGSGRGDEVQVYNRIVGVEQTVGYVFSPEDRPQWLSLLQETNSSVYARLCAAYFLLNEERSAREFVESQLVSANPRHRFNAAKIIRIADFRATGETRDWMVTTILHLLEGTSLHNREYWESSRSSFAGGDLKQFPEGDHYDLQESPRSDLFRSLGSLKDTKAVPALIAMIQRGVDVDDAARALGHIGSPEAGPVLLELLKSRKPDNTGGSEVIALAQLKFRPVAPFLAARLNATNRYGSERLLEALLNISDRSVAGDVATFLGKVEEKEIRFVAQRVLIQLNEADPVPKLLNLYQTLEESPDPTGRDAERYKAQVIRDLGRYTNSLGIATLANIANTSDSAFLRRDAIWALETSGCREAISNLVALLDHQFPEKLTANWGWKGLPTSWQEEFQRQLTNTLSRATKQDFGTNSAAWRAWLQSEFKE